MESFQIDENGWLRGVRHRFSTHYDQRPDGIDDISLLVIHCISLPPCKFGGEFINALFLGKLDSDAHPYFKNIAHLKVAAHVLIRRDGEVVQYVSFQHRAWHAGRSSYAGREECNDYGIGIELEGCERIAYTALQYQQLAKITKALQQRWTCLQDTQRIVGHSDVAPGRKTDPGELFDWQRYRQLLKT